MRLRCARFAAQARMPLRASPAPSTPPATAPMALTLTTPLASTLVAAPAVCANAAPRERLALRRAPTAAAAARPAPRRRLLRLPLTAGGDVRRAASGAARAGGAPGRCCCWGSGWEVGAPCGCGRNGQSAMGRGSNRTLVPEPAVATRRRAITIPTLCAVCFTTTGSWAVIAPRSRR